jgi:hypothetical protein
VVIGGLDGATVSFDYGGHYCQTQSGAAASTAAGRIRTIETVEYDGKSVSGKALSGVCKACFNPAVDLRQTESC